MSFCSKTGFNTYNFVKVGGMEVFKVLWVRNLWSVPDPFVVRIGNLWSRPFALVLGIRLCRTDPLSAPRDSRTLWIRDFWSREFPVFLIIPVLGFSHGRVLNVKRLFINPVGGFFGIRVRDSSRRVVIPGMRYVSIF